MKHDRATGREQRRDTRVLLPVGYAPVRIGVDDFQPTANEGHAYDLSVSGVRFELDESLTAGQPVRLELDLPGVAGTARTVHARGTVVRHHEPDEVGPIRMALQFDQFATSEDRIAVEQYVGRAIAGLN